MFHNRVQLRRFVRNKTNLLTAWLTMNCNFDFKLVTLLCVQGLLIALHSIEVLISLEHRKKLNKIQNLVLVFRVVCHFSIATDWKKTVHYRWLGWATGQ